MKTAATRSELEKYLGEKRNKTIGFVPTMGALHEGHISLVREAQSECETIVVSIFVNPTQFNDPEDLKNYPRTLDNDLKLLEKERVDLVFMPDTKEIYPEPDERIFDFGTTDKVMEGASRPGHFNGVAQVVSKLFDIVKPDKAYFGEKDFQQVAVIKALVRQLGIKVEIVVCPTVREKDGLAMSSRNILLSPEHRQAAPKIYKALLKGAEMASEGKNGGNYQNANGIPSPREVERYVTDLLNSERLLEVIYFKIVNATTLGDATCWNEEGGVEGCIAVKAGNVRLIDNIRFR